MKNINGQNGGGLVRVFSGGILRNLNFNVSGSLNILNFVHSAKIAVPPEVVSVSSHKCENNSVTGLSLDFAPFLSFKSRSAFTLAEVLITIGIIGIVAALIIPYVTTQYKNHVTVQKLKKSYSTVANMLKMAEAHNGSLTEWPEWSQSTTWYERSAEAVIKKYLAPNISAGDIFSNDDSGDSSHYLKKFMCYREGTSPKQDAELNGDAQYIYLNKRLMWSVLTNRNPRSFQLADGTCVGLEPKGVGTEYISFVYIDINGPQKPNIVGRDFFIFVVTLDGHLKPYGSELSDDLLKANCDPRDKINGVGDHCAAKIIRDGWKITY